MSTNPSKSFKVIDIGIQLGLVVATCIWPRWFFVTILFAGGVWQLFSYAIHRDNKFSNEDGSARSTYWMFTKIALWLLGGGLVLIGLGSIADTLSPVAGLGLIMWFVCLLLGPLLYISYLIICIIEVSRHEHYSPTTSNNQHTYEN